MALFYTLIILVSGFVYCQIHPVIKNKLYRYEGQFLYLKAGQYGICFLLLSSLLMWFLEKYLYFPTFSPIAMNKFSILNFLDAFLSENKFSEKANSRKSACVIFLSFCTLFLPFLFACLETLRLRVKYSSRKIKPYIISNILKDSPLDYFLFKASMERASGDKIFVMLTMADRKVYVGKIISLGEPSETQGPDQEIEILPIVSGYRDKDTLTVTFTTYYSVLGEDVKLILKQDGISSATNFKQENYDIFQKNKKKKRPIRKMLDFLMG